MRRNRRLMLVAPEFHAFISKKHIETGIPMIKLTKNIAESGGIDPASVENIVQDRLWGVFHKKKSQ